MTDISISQLRFAIDLVFNHFESCGKSTFSIDDDFYWDVPQDKRYDSYEPPTQLDIGQLSDDLGNIARLTSNQRSPVGNDLVWLSAILRRIGETSEC